MGQNARTVAELAAHVGGEVHGDGARRVRGVNGLAEAGPEDISFYGNARYRTELESTRAAAVLTGADAPLRPGLTYVRVALPHLAFAKISRLFHPQAAHAPGVSPRAHVHAEAKVESSATVMAGATVERGARVGARTVLFPGAYVGEESSVGADCVLYPNAVVRERCTLGDRVILHPCAVIGADGFGFAFDPTVPEHFKIPQVGAVRLGDDVEIGAGSCVDRGTIGDTTVGRGTKIDNLVQIGHNVQVGPLAVVCAQTGIAGSAEIGAGVVFGGQVGVINHLKVGDRVKAGARTLILDDVEAGKTVSGTPALPHKEWLRNAVAFKQLAQLATEVRRLRARMEQLETKGDKS